MPRHTIPRDPNSVNVAAIYARVSSEEQSRNFSIETQIALCRDLATRHGYQVPDDYILCDPGASGYVLDRPGLTRLRQLVTSRAIAALCIQDTDRLSRKAWHQGMLHEELESHGVRLCSANQPLPPELEGTPEGALFKTQKSAMDQYYRDNMVRNLARGRRTRASKGLPSGGMTPYGYRRVALPHGGRFEVVDAEAAIVRHIYSWCANDGLSTRLIAQRLTRQGVPTRTGLHRWHALTVWKIPTNPMYTGTAHYGKTTRTGKTTRLPQPRETWIAIPVEPIITQETFERAQQQLRVNTIVSWSRGRKQHHYLLLAPGLRLFTCGRCQGAMAGVIQGQCRRYRCSSYNYTTLGRDTVCRGSIRADLVESYVWATISQIMVSPQRLLPYLQRLWDQADAQSETLYRQWRAMEKQIAAIDTKVRRWDDAYERGAIDVGTLQGHHQRLGQERSALTQRLREIQDELDAANRRLTDIDHVLWRLLEIYHHWKDGEWPEFERAFTQQVQEHYPEIQQRLEATSIVER